MQMFQLHIDESLRSDHQNKARRLSLYALPSESYLIVQDPLKNNQFSKQEFFINLKFNYLNLQYINKHKDTYMAPKNSSKSEKVRTQLFKSPFPHMLVTNFLSPEVYKKTVDIYNKLQFKQKSSDLFHFFQTLQLNQYDKLNYFKDQLDKQFWRLPPMNQHADEDSNKKDKAGNKTGKIKKQDTFYNIFASYYFEGDYLLCHDDVVEDRLYAFSYYLEDHDSADLVLFNKDANKASKRINVKKNTLAIFEVSDISYHEVDFCHKDGRKAITGWFNVKGLGDKRKWKTIPQYVPKLPIQPIMYALPQHYLSQEYFQLIDIEYQFNVTKTIIEGPFYERRAHKIQISPCVVFQLPGYKLLSAQFHTFKEGDYILLNDPINKIEGSEGIIDIFVTKLSQNFVTSEPAEQGDDQDEEGNVLVKIVQQDQEPSGIPEIDDSLFIVHRGKKQYYVERVAKGKQFTLGHFIYVPDIKKKQKKEKQLKNKNKAQSLMVPEKLKRTHVPKNKVKAKALIKQQPKQKNRSSVVKSKTKVNRKVKNEESRVTKIQQKSMATRKIKKTA